LFIILNTINKKNIDIYITTPLHGSLGIHQALQWKYERFIGLKGDNKKAFIASPSLKIKLTLQASKFSK